MNVKNIFLESKQLYLRPHMAADLEDWANWFNDPLVTQYLEKGYFPNTIAMQTERLQTINTTPTHFQLAIVDKLTDVLVGTVGLHNINLINRNGDISIVIGNQSFWGKQYGKAAVALMVEHGFSKLNLHKITAGMVESNAASQRLFSSLGFIQDTILKEHLFINGKYQDQIMFSLFQRDWLKKNKN